MFFHFPTRNERGRILSRTSHLHLITAARQVRNTQPAMEKLWRFQLDLVFQHPDQSRSKPSPLTSRRRTSRSISAGGLESGLCQDSRHPVCTSRHTVEKAPPTVGVPTTWTLTAIPLVSYHCLSTCKIVHHRSRKKYFILNLYSIINLYSDNFC